MHLRCQFGIAPRAGRGRSEGHAGALARSSSPLDSLGVADGLRGRGRRGPPRRRLLLRVSLVVILLLIVVVLRMILAVFDAVAVAASPVLGSRRRSRPATAMALVGEHGHELVVVQPVEVAGSPRRHHLHEGHGVAQRPAVRAPPRRRELRELVRPRHLVVVVVRVRDAPGPVVVRRHRDLGRQLRHADADADACAAMRMHS